MAEIPDYVRANRDDWNAASDSYQQQHHAALTGERAMAWGVWRIPESEVRALPDTRDRDVLELGCGGGQWSIALALQGARVIGLDISSRQLQHARRHMEEAGVDFPLIEASAEAVPLPDESLDVIFCDHGAMTFCDPYRTVPEAARLLRPGGVLAFASTSPLLLLCTDPATDAVGDRLLLPYFDLYKIDEGGTAHFQLPHGAWIDLFRASGFTVARLVELRPGPGDDTTYGGYVPLDWARRWPAEQLWVVRKIAGQMASYE